jgi:hypothetical protein
VVARAAMRSLWESVPVIEAILCIARATLAAAQAIPVGTQAVLAVIQSMLAVADTFLAVVEAMLAVAHAMLAVVQSFLAVTQSMLAVAHTFLAVVQSMLAVAHTFLAVVQSFLAVVQAMLAVTQAMLAASQAMLAVVQDIRAVVAAVIAIAQYFPADIHKMMGTNAQVLATAYLPAPATAETTALYLNGRDLLKNPVFKQNTAFLPQIWPFLHQKHVFSPTFLCLTTADQSHGRTHAEGIDRGCRGRSLLAGDFTRFRDRLSPASRLLQLAKSGRIALTEGRTTRGGFVS